MSGDAASRSEAFREGVAAAGRSWEFEACWNLWLLERVLRGLRDSRDTDNSNHHISDNQSPRP